MNVPALLFLLVGYLVLIVLIASYAWPNDDDETKRT